MRMEYVKNDQPLVYAGWDDGSPSTDDDVVESLCFSFVSYPPFIELGIEGCEPPDEIDEIVVTLDAVGEQEYEGPTFKTTISRLIESAIKNGGDDDVDLRRKLRTKLQELANCLA